MKSSRERFSEPTNLKKKRPEGSRVSSPKKKKSKFQKNLKKIQNSNFLNDINSDNEIQDTTSLS